MSFWCWVSWVAFARKEKPTSLGLMGVTRRMRVFISIQFLFVIAVRRSDVDRHHRRAMLVSSRQHLEREALKDTTGDPWNGRTLE